MKPDVAHDPRMLVGFFSIFFLIGVYAIRSQLPSALPMIFFHATLLVNTFYSIECFGPRTPVFAHGQGIVDFFLVSIYVLSPFFLGSPSVYLLSVTLLFIIASLKYTLLIRVIADLRLMQRKLVIDLCGVLWNFCAFLLLSSGLIAPALLLWIWASGFAGMNIYLLKIKPMYCLTAP